MYKFHVQFTTRFLGHASETRGARSGGASGDSSRLMKGVTSSSRADWIQTRQSKAERNNSVGAEHSQERHRRSTGDFNHAPIVGGEER